MQDNSTYFIIEKHRRCNLSLVEKLQHHLQKFQERSDYKYLYNSLTKRNVEIVINPSANELKQFLKDQPRQEGLRGLYLGNNFYFWNQYELLHEEVARALHLRYENASELISRSFEITNHNSIHPDHWDKIAELQREMTKNEGMIFFAKCLNTIKALNRVYHTRTDDLKSIMRSFLRVYNDYEVDYNDFSRKTPQERHNIRKARYDQRAQQYGSLFNMF